MITWKTLVLIAAVGLMTPIASYAAPLLPGDQTDPTASTGRPTATSRGHEPEEPYRYPYISTYYVEPTVKAGDEVVVDYYVTDWDQSEIRFADDSWKFDVMVELVTERTAADLPKFKLPAGEFKPPAPVKKVAPKKAKPLTPAEKSRLEREARQKAQKEKAAQVKAAKARKTMAKSAPRRPAKAAAKKGPGPIVVKDVPAGDGSVSLGRLPAGDYAFGIWCKDMKGRESHRVWHLFRVRDAADLTVPEKAVHTMTEADLAGYGLANDDRRERRMPNGKASGAADSAQPGYTVEFRAGAKDIAVPGAYKTRKVTYDPGYDKAAVEAEALDNVKGLNQFMADLSAAGYRKLVLLPGTYRLSATAFLTLPDNFTLDLNGAVLKENGFTGDHAAMVKFESTYDAHLVNGVVEGDYFEHDYEHSPNDSEWPMGIEIVGESQYSSVENVTVRDITGYGGGNGFANDRKGGMAHWLRGIGWGEPGVLDRHTGKPDSKVKGWVTSDFIDLPADATYLQVSKYLGYQGFACGGWWMTVCFYSSGNKLISAETGFQYRAMRVPAGATKARVSVEAASVADVPSGEGKELVAYRMRTPQNCSIVNCQFFHDRCVGYAASGMKNFLFRGNSFDHCGDAEAMCSFDAEDGWDLMQDVYLDGNKFGYNHVMCDMIGCGGHNFICENNVGRIYFWGRCYSPVARKNSGINGVFHCTSRRRSGYGRFGNDNKWPYGIELGAGKNPHVDWEFGMRGVEFSPEKRPPAKIIVDKTGRLSGSTFVKTEVPYPMLSSCKMLGCNCALPGEGEWNGCKMKTCTFSGGTTLVLSDCKIMKSTFRYIVGGKLTFRRCTLEGVTFANVDADRVVFEDCTLNGTNPPAK